MPKKELIVTLVTDGMYSPPTYLDVGDAELQPDGEKHRITWSIRDGQLLGAKFVNDKKFQAFDLVAQEGKYEVGAPVVFGNGRQMRVDVTHTGKETKGRFVYRLAIVAGDLKTYYTTQHTDRATRVRMVNNPVIINKVDPPMPAGPIKPTKKKAKPAAKQATKKAAAPAKKIVKKAVKRPAAKKSTRTAAKKAVKKAVKKASKRK